MTNPNSKHIINHYERLSKATRYLQAGIFSVDPFFLVLLEMMAFRSRVDCVDHLLHQN